MYSFLSYVRPAVFNEWWNVAIYQNIILFSEQLLYNKLDGVLWKRESYLYDLYLYLQSELVRDLTNLIYIQRQYFYVNLIIIISDLFTISIVYKLQHTLFTESSCWLFRDAFIKVSHCDFWIDKSNQVSTVRSLWLW